MKLIKRLSAVLLCILLAVSFAVPAFADEATATAPGPELRGAADSLDLGNDAEAYTADMQELHAQGVQLFDTASLLTAEEKDKLEVILTEVSKATGMDVGVITTTGLDGRDTDDYADLLYNDGGFGTGSDKDGTILVISVGTERDVTIYAYGIGNRYLTDRGKNYIFDEVNGGMINALADGKYGQACAIYAQGVLTLYNEGIQQDQGNQNENGQIDYYYPQEKKHISIFEILIAGVVSAISGILPVNGVKRKYAMEAEKHLAQGFNQAYKASAVYNIVGAAAGTDAQLIDHFTKTIPIPRPQPTDGGRNGGTGGHGGGITTVSSGRGSGVHSSSSRKF